MNSWKVKGIALISLLLLLVAPSSNGAERINRVFGWTDSSGLTLSETNVVYGVNGNPCFTFQFKSSCDPKNVNLDVVNALGPCSEFDSPCISEVWIQDYDGVYQKGTYQGERVKAWEDYSWENQVLPGISKSHVSNLYTFPNVRHSKGNLYEIVPMLESRILAGNSAQPQNLKLTVAPVHLDSSASSEAKACLPYNEQMKSVPNKPCWRIGEDVKNPKIRVTLKLPTLPSGWITGRLAKVSLSTSESTENGSGSLITISGVSTRVANIMNSYFSDVPSDRAAWTSLATALNMDAWEKPYSWGTYRTPEMIDDYVRLVSLFPNLDKATSEAQKWVVNFNWNSNFQISDQCQSGSLIGYAGSNAMTFGSEIPKYNTKDRSIDYRVASPHFYSDGSLDLGQYELVLNQNVAKCVWGVKEIPSVASLQVLTSDGNTKVSTATMQIVGNYLRFNASGFTFSSSTIKIGFGNSQENLQISLPEKEVFGTASPAASPTATPEPAPLIEPSKKPTIITFRCYKGTKSILLKQTSKKCPKGYSLKR